MQLVEKGKFVEARMAFELARRLTPTQPDVLNMLAYTQRKTGALDLAIANYKNALRQRPDFPQAREYLGEAYVQAALRELTALERAGPSAGNEYAALLRALHDMAGELPPRPDSKQNDW
jgi:cytochrome c-type biogenesis protein CcmH/NrfG